MTHSKALQWTWPLVVALAVMAAVAVAPRPASAATPVTTDISVLDSDGNGIAGVQIIYAVDAYSGWMTLGTTDGAGHLATSAPAGNYLLEANYNQGSARTPSAVDISQPYTFHTVKVTLLNSGLTYATNAYSGWLAYTGPMQMFPGEYSLDTGRSHPRFTVGNTNFTGGVLTLLDHAGNGLAGGTADSYLGSWSALPGTTDAAGNLVFSIPNDSPYLSIAMYYNGTRNQQSRSQLTASNFTFQTALANVKLEDADGNPLDTGSVSFYAGSWRPAQDTSGGLAAFEMLPGSYSFAMAYNHTREQRNGVAISGPSTDVVFQTGRLTAYFSQPFSWYNSQFYAFTPATQEFLPGQVGLALAGCNTAMFPIAAGDHLTKTGIVATLVNSANQPLAGGVATVYAGGWKSVGTTGANGKTCAAVDGHLGNATVAMVYNGTRQQLTQNAQVNAVYAFKTTGVTVELRDHNGNLMDTGAASYYAGGWQNIGNTSGGTATVQMLPGSYSFAMTFNGTRQQLNGEVISGNADTVTFQTTLVNVYLRSHNGPVLDIPNNGGASYYAGGWHAITTPNQYNPSMVTAEMLPGTYSFALTYNGTRDQQVAAIAGSGTTVRFNAVLVTVDLKSHDDSSTLDIDANGSASYYAGGWRTMPSAKAEMLPGTYSFAVVYKGTREQKSFTISKPAPYTTGDEQQTVMFHTGQVHSDSGNATSYYAGGWKPFAQDMELLPGTYWFAFSDQPQAASPLTGGTTNHIH